MCHESPKSVDLRRAIGIGNMRRSDMCSSTASRRATDAVAAAADGGYLLTGSIVFTICNSSIVRREPQACPSTRVTRNQRL